MKMMLYNSHAQMHAETPTRNPILGCGSYLSLLAIFAPKSYNMMFYNVIHSLGITIWYHIFSTSSFLGFVTLSCTSLLGDWLSCSLRLCYPRLVCKGIIKVYPLMPSIYSYRFIISTLWFLYLAYYKVLLVL